MGFTTTSSRGYTQALGSTYKSMILRNEREGERERACEKESGNEGERDEVMEGVMEEG